MLSFFFASPVAMELLKVCLRHRAARTMETPQGLVLGAPVAGFAQQGANLASISQQFGGGGNMLRILLPVAGSRNCQFAAKHVIKEFMNNTAMEIHLLNVQPPFSSYIARFVSRKSLRDYHRDAAEKALGPVKQMLDGFSIPEGLKNGRGPGGTPHASGARRSRSDPIVMSTARK